MLMSDETMATNKDNVFDAIFGSKKKAIASVADISEQDVPILRMEFLRLSPSYNLAIKLLAQRKKLDDPKVIQQVLRLYEAPSYQMKKRGHYKKNQERFDDKQIPIVMEIFQKVVDTAKKFGDLNDEYKGRVKVPPYAHWTSPYLNYPNVGLIGVWNERGQPHSRFLNDLEKFNTWAQDEYAYEPALVLLVPLRANTKVIKKTIDDFLKEFRDPEANTKYVEKVPLYGKRIHPDAILKKLKLLICRFMYPDLLLWELGVKANISQDYTDYHKRKGLSTRHKERLSVLTSRMLNQAMLLAENAAVGMFPMTQKNLIPNYDAEKTLERIQKRWPDLKP